MFYEDEHFHDPDLECPSAECFILCKKSVKPCQTYNRNVHAYTSKEAPSSTDSVYIPINNSHNNIERVSKREREEYVYVL